MQWGRHSSERRPVPALTHTPVTFLQVCGRRGKEGRGKGKNELTRRLRQAHAHDARAHAQKRVHGPADAIAPEAAMKVCVHARNALGERGRDGCAMDREDQPAASYIPHEGLWEPCEPKATRARPPSALTASSSAALLFCSQQPRCGSPPRLGLWCVPIPSPVGGCKGAFRSCRTVPSRLPPSLPSVGAVDGMVCGDCVGPRAGRQFPTHGRASAAGNLHPRPASASEPAPWRKACQSN